MGEITPDLVEWMLADNLVASKWKNIASYLELTNYIPNIDSRRGRCGRLWARTDREKLCDVLSLWKIVKRPTYTLPHLLRMLDKLGLKDMYEWIRLMSGQTLSKADIESLVLRQMNSTPRPLSVRSELTGLRRTRPSSHYFSLPASPRYTPQPSRPLSQISFWNPECLGGSMSGRSSVSPRRDTYAERIAENRSKHSGVFDTLYKPNHIRKPSLYSHRSEDLMTNGGSGIERPLSTGSQDKITNPRSASDQRASFWDSGTFHLHPTQNTPLATSTPISSKLEVRRRTTGEAGYVPNYTSTNDTKNQSPSAANKVKRHSSFISSAYSEAPLLKIIENFEKETKNLTAPNTPKSASTMAATGMIKYPVITDFTPKYPVITDTAPTSHTPVRSSSEEFGRRTGLYSKQSTEKYFDNLITLIEAASSSLEI